MSIVLTLNAIHCVLSSLSFGSCYKIVPPWSWVHAWSWHILSQHNLNRSDMRHLRTLGVTVCFDIFFFPSAMAPSDIPGSDCSISLDERVRMSDDVMKLSPQSICNRHVTWAGNKPSLFKPQRLWGCSLLQQNLVYSDWWCGYIMLMFLFIQFT